MLRGHHERILRRVRHGEFNAGMRIRRRLPRAIRNEAGVQETPHAGIEKLPE